MGRLRRQGVPGRQPAHQAVRVLGVADRARSTRATATSIFLAEAFTRRAVMRHLAKIGFSQSYTYFTWKNSRWELTEYVSELAYSGEQEYFRPNFFANTPDILHAYLQHGGRPAFEARLVLAATLSPSYGIYSGFENFENVAVARGLGGVPALREVRDQEARARRAAAAADRAAERDPAREPRAAGALERHLPRHRQRRADRLRQAVARATPSITVVNIDPHQPQEGLAVVPASLGLPPSFTVHDLLSDERFQWRIGAELRPARARRAPGARDSRSRADAAVTGPPTLTHLIAAERAGAAREPRRRADRRPSAQTRQWFEAEPLWFKRAVFYEIHIRGFFDANGDGSGDFRGLTEKLDYLQWLGIDCIWLLPFYHSPLRDGGYDISDFTDVHPDYGTVDDVHELIDAAHARRIRVIADLVMNHTSSDHPWFQESRSSPDSPKRDWYVWSDTDERYQDARIIFIDTETSNWTWDPVAGAYYWHRFFSHQPDLNYDNPEVQEAMLDVLRFWLDLGLDGFRLDAVPYLFEREGTNCENLPETHAYLKRVRTRGRRELPRPRAARRGQPVAGRRRRSTSATATSARWRSTSR